MKKTLLYISIIAVSLLACNIASASTPAPQVVTEPTDVVVTVQPATSTPNGIAVSFQHVSFIIPEGLAAGANSEIVPAVPNEEESAPWDIAPEYILFTFNGYSTSTDDRNAPTMRVFPAQGYADVNPGGSRTVPALRTLLADPAAPLTVDSIPGVPYYNAEQVIAAQATRLNFQSGSGIRTVTFYAQYPAPIMKNGQFYYFQGLTSDGNYYVVATLPLVSPLQSTAENPSADGQTYPDPNLGMDPAAFDQYYPAMTEILNAANPDSFSPSLSQIDALIQSITITP